MKKKKKKNFDVSFEIQSSFLLNTVDIHIMGLLVFSEVSK